MRGTGWKEKFPMKLSCKDSRSLIFISQDPISLQAPTSVTFLIVIFANEAFTYFG